MATLIVKRSVVLNGAKTSVSLENKFWDGLQEIARSENLTGFGIGREDCRRQARERQSLVRNSRVCFGLFPNARQTENNFKRTRFGNSGPECLPLTTQHVRVRTDIALILKYSSSGELGMQRFLCDNC